MAFKHTCLPYSKEQQKEVMGDVFQVVKYKGRKQKPDRGVNFSGPEFIVDYVALDSSIILGQIKNARENFEASEYISNLISGIEKSHKQVDHLLCYGLGSFCESYISRHQLAALLAIKDRFKCPALAYDPIFSPNEVQVLNDFGVEVIEKNDEAKRAISTSGITLVYFAHCSSQLVNNFLWANWNSILHKCVILSNSFSTVINRNDEKTVTSLSCLRDVLELTEEYIVEDVYDVENVFNDLAVHTFPAAENTNAEFWVCRPEPCYQGQVLEFCTKEVVITLRPV